MPYQDIELGLTLEIPTSRTRNWGTRAYSGIWTRISEHSHTGSGDGNKIPTAGLEDEAVTTEKLYPVWGKKVAAAAIPTGTATTLNMQSALVFPIDLGLASGDVAVTFLNPEPGAEYKLIVTQAATPRNLTFGTIKWENGQAPILSSGNDEIDIIDLFYDGTTWYGRWSVNYG